MTEYDTPMPKSNLAPIDLRPQKGDMPYGALWQSQFKLSKQLGLKLISARAKIADGMMIVAIIAGLDGKCVGISLNANWYSGRGLLQYRTVKEVLELLTRAGLLRLFKVPRKSRSQYIPGLCSFFTPTLTLIKEIGALVLNDEHLTKERTTDIITLKDDNKFFAIPDTKQYRLEKEFLLTQNEFMQGAHLSSSSPNLDPFKARLCSTDQMKRCVFRGDKREAFDKYGGRYYGTCYQNCLKTLRPYIYINGFETCEEDYSQTHPTLLREIFCTKSQRTLANFDSYVFPVDCQRYNEIFHTCEMQRGFQKGVVNTLLNAPSYQKAIWSVTFSLIGQCQNLSVENARTMAGKIQQSAKSHNDDIAKFFYSDVGVRLQAIDAGMSRQIQSAGRDAGIHVLNLHDGFIVSTQHKAWLIEQMYASKEQALFKNRNMDIWR